MILRIKSENENLMSILNKNPNTDLGLYLKPLRNGHIVGNVVDKNNYEVVFCDTKFSYTSYEDNSMDFKSFCSPEVILNIIRDIFPQLLKTQDVYYNGTIPWLGDKSFKEVDSVGCEIVVDNFLINSGWYRNGEFLLSRYIPNVIVDENGKERIYKLTIKGDNVYDAFNLLGLVSFLTALTNSNDYYVDNSQVVKYSDVLVNIKNIPYFVYYLFIKRAVRSSKTFDEIVDKLQQKFSQDNGGIYTKFTPNDTHRDRILYCASHLDFEKPILYFGCGELKHEKYSMKHFKNTVWSYDIEDVTNLHNSIIQNNKIKNWFFTTNLQDIDKDLEYQVVLTEVIEHNKPTEMLKELKKTLKDFKISKLIITTPDKDFNKNYLLEDNEVRLDDHVFEYTLGEFKNFCEQLSGLQGGIEYHQIGDVVGSNCVTLGSVISYE